MDWVGDMLIVVFIWINIDLCVLGEIMKYIGLVVVKFGISFEEVVVMVGMFVNNGFCGSDVGMVMCVSLFCFVLLLKVVVDVLKELGVLVVDVRGKMCLMEDVLFDFYKVI